ncbi:MAG: hypothetical protein LBL66_06630, partial [Clostridiales bacterium]|nr:hypothetical protein [Clostridiales bacterium]
SGTYRVVYNYWDSHNPDFVQSSYNNGNVMEYEPPVLTVGGAVPATAKVGTAVKLPAAEATDNATAAARIKINVYIVLPNGDALFFAVAREGESGGTEYVGPTFTPAAAGRYVIRYVATDACENYAVKEFVLTAE